MGKTQGSFLEIEEKQGGGIFFRVSLCWGSATLKPQAGIFHQKIEPQKARRASV
jgi:hypothetical protein